MEGKVVSFKYNKQLIRTVYSDDSGFFARLFNLEHAKKRKSEPVYRIDIILTISINGKDERVTAMKEAKAADMPFFQFDKGDYVKVIEKNGSIERIENVTAKKVYEF